MEFLGTRKQESLTIASDTRTMAIREKFGDETRFMTTWTPNNLQMISASISRSVKAEVPSLVMMMKTYGREVVEGNLAIFVAGAFARMGEIQLDINDAQNVANLICDTLDYRLLNYAFVVNFFNELQQGKWEIYAGKPVQILRAFNQYSKQAMTQQMKLREKEETERRRIEAEEHAKNSITWEQFLQTPIAKKMNIQNLNNPLKQEV